MKHAIRFVTLRGITALVLISLILVIPAQVCAAPGDETTNAQLSLVPSFENISVYFSFSGDNNQNNQASLYYRQTGTGIWKPGITMTVDRRDTLDDPYASSFNNPYINQWRAIVFGLNPSTSYDVKVEYSDVDGGSGAVQQTVMTKNDDPPSNGNTYYVATNGNDSTGNGSSQNPWRTISHAATMVAPGDTIRIRPGTYAERVVLSVSGKANNYITFRSDDPNNMAIITDTDDWGVIRLTDIDYIRLQYLDVRATATWRGSGIYIRDDAVGNIIEDCVLTCAGDDWYAAGIILRDGVNNTLIQRNYITTTANGSNGPFGVLLDETAGSTVIRYNNIIGDFYDGIGGGPNFGSNGGPYKDSYIYGNVIDDANDDGIESEGGGMNVAIWDNTITNCWHFSIGICPVIIGPTYVFRNTCINTGTNGHIKLGHADSYGSYGFTYLYHNTFYQTDNAGVCYYGKSSIVDNMYFRNNIFYIPDGYLVEESGSESIGAVDYDYNCMYSGGDGWVKWMNTPMSYSQWISSYGQEAHGISEDPRVTSPNDMHLQSDSPCINRGVILPGFNDASSPWPYSGSGPDIGTNEYTGVPSADNTPPYTTGHSPAKNAEDVAPGTNIIVHVRDSVTGVNQSSIQMRVEGLLVSPTITGTPYDYTVTYNPPADFDYEQVVNVTLNAQDLNATPNVMAQDSYSFTIRSETSDPDPPAGPVVIPFRVNCGGSDYIDIGGNLWNADQEYVSGSWGFTGNGLPSDFGTAVAVSNTLDDRIFQTARWALDGYQFDISNGQYDVSLLFAENYFSQSGSRIFDVRIEGMLVLDNLDIYSRVGDHAALIETVSGITVGDGQLSITFDGITQDPAIYGIMITESDGDPGGGDVSGGDVGGGSDVGGDDIGGDDNLEITGVSNFVNASGQFNIAVSVPSSDNKVRIDIPKDTVATNSLGLRLTSISIEKITTSLPPPDDGVIVGSVYDITPDGANFEPSINLVMSYADSEIPYGISEKNMIVGCFDGSTGVWNPVPSSTNPVDNTVTANLEHFSRYAILAYTNPANFEIVDISMYPDIVTCGSNVDIQATIINTGDMAGDYEVNLMLDGEVLATELITLDGGEVTTLLFSTITDIAGIHRISIGAVESTFTAEVYEAPAHLITSNINVSPNEIYLGESIEISTLISNTGDLAGVYEAILKIDNETVDSKSINVAGGDSEIVIFTVTPGTEGEHVINIGEKVVFLTVKATAGVDVEKIKKAKPEISRFEITPTYDPRTGKIKSTRIDYQIINSENLSTGSMLILKVFRDGDIWEEIPLITLNQLETSQDTGYLSYVPSTGWDVGTYIFEAELKEQNGAVQSIQFEKFTLIEESITKAVSWGSLGIIIGGTLIVLLTVLAIVIYRRREMLRGYVE